MAHFAEHISDSVKIGTAPIGRNPDILDRNEPRIDFDESLMREIRPHFGLLFTRDASTSARNYLFTHLPLDPLTSCHRMSLTYS